MSKRSLDNNKKTKGEFDSFTDKRKKSADREGKKKIKKQYVSMEITRINLNPEQAVLSCCDSGGRDQITMIITQCGLTACGSAPQELSS